MIQPHGGMPEESDAGGGVPWPTFVEALGAGVDVSSVGASDVGSGVGSADVVSGSGDSLVGSGAADDDVGSGAAEDDVGFGVAEVVDGAGDADSASLVLSDGSGESDSVGVSLGVSVGVSLGGSDVRLGSEGSERDGVGRVGRSLGSEMPPLPHPVTSPTTSAAPAAPVRSFDRTLIPVRPGGLSRRGYLSTDSGAEGASAPTRDLRVGASSAAAWLAGTREGVGEGRGCSWAVAARRGRAEHGAG